MLGSRPLVAISIKRLFKSQILKATFYKKFMSQIYFHDIRFHREMTRSEGICGYESLCLWVRVKQEDLILFLGKGNIDQINQSIEERKK